ncbi:Thymus-specific serine protease [Myotis davidii]|uniref:Thymus-specific serine protease n=1 Tax=Myotis davidii TaxID=225400 RepID=L5LWE5_MYODS|nr:Thymus-specific serine protease [Myotis davidii]
MARGPALWLGALLLASLGGSSAPASLLRRLGEHIRRFQESSVLGLSLGPGVAARPREGWLEQPLDPFNASDRRSFLQRYWISDQHWASRDGPVFLHLGGEGSLGPGSVMRGHPAALAPALGALVIGLEHRFYGLSIPAGGLNTTQLRFLSSRHALADVVSARLELSRLLNVSSSSRWVCFGGSYAGSLAAWARLKFPHLLFAAVASSAPVRAVLDFSAYNEVVTHSLGQRCLSFSRAETLAQLRVTEPPVSGVGDRQWLYQTCTEFGFYVTCEDPTCPFSKLPALPSQLELCEQVFGLSTWSTVQAVAQTNSYYGGQTPVGTQVLFVNGDMDPWHVLSVTQDLGPSVSALLIPNASHCLDMAPERSSDTPSLRLGRQSILQQLQTWLQLAQKSLVRVGV